jgi:hypothetical protein
MRFLGWGFVFVAAAIFIVMLVGAQIGCPIPACKGPKAMPGCQHSFSHHSDYLRL